MYFGGGIIRIMAVIAVSTAVFTGTQALADGAQGQSRANRHQMLAMVITCMRRQMSADQALSYNGAMKLCKEQSGNQLGRSSSGNMVAETTSAKP